MITTMTLKMSR